MQNQNFKKPSYGGQAQQKQHSAVQVSKPNSNASGAKNPATKITGLFKSEKSKGYEVKVTEEVAAKLRDIPVGSYLKVYENKSEKTGTEYLSLSVKTIG